jgi:hypothetical protein
MSVRGPALRNTDLRSRHAHMRLAVAHAATIPPRRTAPTPPAPAAATRGGPLTGPEGYGGRPSGVKTSDAVKLSSCVGKFPGAGGEGGGFVVVLAGGEAVVQAAEQAAEQVALGGGVPVAGVASPVVVGAGAG